jgi:hypothetical protein
MKKYKYKGDPNLMIQNNFDLFILDCLGAGAFGRVFRCYDGISNKFFALKVRLVEEELTEPEKLTQEKI